MGVGTLEVEVEVVVDTILVEEEVTELVIVAFEESELLVDDKEVVEVGADEELEVVVQGIESQPGV